MNQLLPLGHGPKLFISGPKCVQNSPICNLSSTFAFFFPKGINAAPKVSIKG